jgi:hypothetical protein
VVWPAAWQNVGYTEKGVDLIMTPTIKSFTPDEEVFSVYDIFDGAKAEISATLWEATLENYNIAISAGIFSDDGKVRKVSVGGVVLRYVAVGFEGPAPVADSMSSPATSPDGRVVVIPKAIAASAIAINVTRKDIQKFAVKWEARKIANQSLYDFCEFYH